MKALWSKLINIGVSKRFNSQLNDHIRSVNFITLVWIPALILIAIQCLQSPFSSYGILALTTTLLMILILLTNKHKNQTITTFSFLLIVNFNLLLINVILEFNYGTFLLLFPLFASITYLFPLPKYKLQLALTLVTMIIIHLTGFIIIHEFPSLQLVIAPHLIFTSLNYGFAFILTFIIVIQYSLIQAKQKKMLDDTIISSKTQHILLEETLKDKNILISEIHHRTKNNLAIVSSILNLQRSQIDDEQLDNILLDCSNRVHSIAAVHQKLYEKGDFSIVDFKEYIGGLVTDLQNTLFPKNKTITVSTDIESFDIKTDQAVSCALILNEVITNSIKYAFNNEGIENKIEIRASLISNQIVIMVHDNGPGFDIKKLHNHKGSLGMSLIEALTEQLEGSYEYHNTGGTTFTLTFKLN